MKITPAKAALLAIILGVPNMGAACLGLGVGIGLQAVAAHGRSVQTQQMNAELAQDRAACSAGDTVACLDYQDALARRRGVMTAQAGVKPVTTNCSTNPVTTVTTCHSY